MIEETGCSTVTEEWTDLTENGIEREKEKDGNVKGKETKIQMIKTRIK